MLHVNAKLLNLYLACKQQQLYEPVNYREFQETGPWSQLFKCWIGGITIQRIN